MWCLVCSTLHSYRCSAPFSAIVTDVEKKKYAVSYTNIKTEKQWKVLGHYMTGMFTEFKKDVLGSDDGTLAGDHDAMQEMKQLMH